MLVYRIYDQIWLWIISCRQLAQSFEFSFCLIHDVVYYHHLGFVKAGSFVHF